MAGFGSLAAAALSLERFLNACFAEEQPVAIDTPAAAALVRTEDFKHEDTSRIPKTGVSIFPYRVDLNRTMRPGWSAVGSLDGRGHLPLDMHVLLTPWASNPEYELQILGRAMQCLEALPIFSGPVLAPSGDWAPNEAVQIVLGEITTEEIMRTFDSLPQDYKLSVPYVLRVVRIDTAATPMREVSRVITGIVPAGLA
jgi:hypothetical protein